MHLEAFSEIVYNFTTSGAVVIGGVWAYFKFVRGRTFSHRAELSVIATAESCGVNIQPFSSRFMGASCES
jgi:hypothetical protein